jgi:hypothetical protein
MTKWELVATATTPPITGHVCTQPDINGPDRVGARAGAAGRLSRTIVIEGDVTIVIEGDVRDPAGILATPELRAHLD